MHKEAVTAKRATAGADAHQRSMRPPAVDRSDVSSLGPMPISMQPPGVPPPLLLPPLGPAENSKPAATQHRQPELRCRQSRLQTQYLDMIMTAIRPLWHD
jgi:hypothetical protein